MTSLAHRDAAAIVLALVASSWACAPKDPPDSKRSRANSLPSPAAPAPQPPAAAPAPATVPSETVTTVPIAKGLPGETLIVTPVASRFDDLPAALINPPVEVKAKPGSSYELYLIVPESSVDPDRVALLVIENPGQPEERKLVIAASHLKLTPLGGGLVKISVQLAFAHAIVAGELLDPEAALPGYEPYDPTTQAAREGGAGEASGESSDAPDRTLIEIRIAPPSATYYPNSTQQFTADCKWSDGSTGCPTLEWYSTFEAVATVDANGLATTLVVGSTNIMARYGSLDSLGGFGFLSVIASP